MGADFYRCVDMIVDRLGARPLVTMLPVGAEADFAGIVDLVNNNAIIWRDESLGAKFDIVEIPADLKEKAAEYRHRLIETAVEADDVLMEAYLDGKEPTVEQLKSAIRKGTVKSMFVPVLCGSAFKNKGVQPLLDGVVSYLPSPADIGFVNGIDDRGNEVVRKSEDSEPFSGLAFKIMTDPFVGSITFMRVYSGKINQVLELITLRKIKKNVLAVCF